MTLTLLVLLTAGVDTKGWETKKLSAMGKEKFAFDGKVKIPPKSKTSSMGTSTGDTLAYVELADGVKVMLMQRGAKQDKDPARLEALLAKTGRLSMQKFATGYFIVVEREDGIVVQGANWAVEPGLDCATEAPITKAQADVVDTICRSFTK